MAQTNTDWKAFLYTTEQSHGKGASAEHDLIALTNTFNKKYVSFLSVAKVCHVLFPPASYRVFI